MNNVVKNAIIFTDRQGIQRLFGEVVQDERWEVGHHIVTSQIVRSSIRDKFVQTETGTRYFVENFFTTDEFVDYIKKTFDEEKVNYYLYYTNLVDNL